MAVCADTPARLIAAAEVIVRRIVESASWDGDHCEWAVQEPVSSRGGRVAWQTVGAGPYIYNGIAGILLLLLEMKRVHYADEELTRTIYGALRTLALQEASIHANSTGFYSGRTGVAYVYARAAAILQDDDWLRRAHQALDKVCSAKVDKDPIDVIGGIAGAIPVLLQLSSTLASNQVAETAVRFGDHLIDVACHESIGWSWEGSFGNGRNRNLLGLAHGASGIAHALMELWAHSGVDCYRYAAEQAFAYERYHLSYIFHNWPDFRLTYEAFGGRLGSASPVPPNIWRASLFGTVAWCHGAPGIGLVRIRTAELVRTATVASDIQAAIQGTLNWLHTSSANNCLCHGLCGNLEFLLSADRAHLADLRAEHITPRIEGLVGLVEAIGGSDVPCGSPAFNPGLMVGQGGVAYFLLRGADESVPSVLLPSSSARRPRNAKADARVVLLRTQYAHSFFRQTLGLVERRYESIAVALNGLLNRVEVGTEATMVADWLEENTRHLRQRNADLDYYFRLESAAYQLLLDADPSAEVIHPATRGWDDALLHVPLVLATNVRLVHIDSESPADAQIVDTQRVYLIHSYGRSTTATRLTRWAVEVLSKFATPNQLKLVADSLLATGEYSSKEAQTLYAATVSQVKAAIDAGIIVRHVPNSSDQLNVSGGQL